MPRSIYLQKRFGSAFRPKLKSSEESWPEKLSLERACRMVAVLKPENSSDLIAFAEKHSSRELDFEVANRNPEVHKESRMKPVSADRVEWKIQISKRLYEKLCRAQDLAARQGAKDLEETPNE